MYKEFVRMYYTRMSTWCLSFALALEASDLSLDRSRSHTQIHHHELSHCGLHTGRKRTLATRNARGQITSGSIEYAMRSSDKRKRISMGVDEGSGDYRRLEKR